MARSIPTDARDLAWRTALGVAVAVVALLVSQAGIAAADLDLGATGANDPFAAGPLVTSAVVAGAGAAVAYAALIRYTDRPVRNFVRLAAAVFVLSLVPVAVTAPELGVTTTGQVVLVVLHALVAVPVVAFLVGWNQT